MNILRYPPSLQWEVTSNCNHNCIHCYNYWRKNEEVISGLQKKLTEEEYLRVATKIIEQKPVSVVITGGEPFLVFDQVKSSVDLLLQNRINVSFNSNVTLITEEIADFLSARKIGVFVSFPCSNEDVCDTITNVKGSLKRVIEKLDLLKRKQVGFLCNMVISKANIDIIDETVAFLIKRYDIKKFSLTRVGKPVNSTEWFNQFLLTDEDITRLLHSSVEVVKKYGIEVQTSCPYTPCSIQDEEAYELFGERGICTAGKTSYAIDTDGNVKACPRDGNLYGNIIKENFEDIWQRMSMWRNGSLIPEQCKSCNKISSCMGGCRVGAFPQTGRLDMPDIIFKKENVPVKFNRKTQIEVMIENTNFVVARNMIVLYDGDTVRLSVGRRYTFVTKELYQFIKEHSEFSIKDFIDYFSVNILQASNVVKVLMNNDIIIKE